MGTHSRSVSEGEYLPFVQLQLVANTRIYINEVNMAARLAVHYKLHLQTNFMRNIRSPGIGSPSINKISTTLAIYCHCKRFLHSKYLFNLKSFFGKNRFYCITKTTAINYPYRSPIMSGVVNKCLQENNNFLDSANCE